MRIEEIRAKKPVQEYLRALVEPPNHTPETKLFHRGDHGNQSRSYLPRR